MNKDNSIGARNWVLIWIIGMIGQLVWNVENSLFNTFVYRVAERNAEIIIQWMVAASATATTISTLLIGTLSDRIGKRRPFIGIGYILWGGFTICFGATRFLPIMYVGAALIMADVCMSFCGSVGNDAGFNAWTTDITNERNRGSLSGALAVMPVIATIVGTAGFGIIVDGIKGTSFSGIGYFPFFIAIGCVAMAVGLFSLLVVREGPDIRPTRNEKGYWAQFFQVFRVREFMKNRELFWVFIVMVTYFIGFNVYFPFIMPYFEHTLDLGLGMAGIITGAGLGCAVIFTIPAARFINRGKGIFIVIFSVVVNFIGLFVLSYAESTQMPVLILGTLGGGMGYVLVLQTLTAWVKNLYPVSQRGQYEGIKLIFFVCLPMVIGPAIGTPLVTRFGTRLLIDGRLQMVPGGVLFRVSAVLTFLTLLPLVAVWKQRRKRPDAAKNS